MWRALAYVGLLCLAAYGAVWLANNPETIAFTWQGREYTTSLSVGVVALLAAVILLAAIVALFRLLFGLPGRWRRASRERRQTRGFRALSRGIVAVGAGDLSAARRYSGEAERLLGEEPLTLLLRAQAAQASGDREAAETSFRRMADIPETRVLGLRGLYLETRRRGDPVSARAYAEEAARIAPAVSWASDAVLEAYSADGEWRKAIDLIERRASLGLVDRATSRRQRAVLYAADAISSEAGDPERALAAAREAVRLAPDLVPAAAVAGRLLSRRGDLRAAAKVVEATWKEVQHPELASVYLNLRPGDSAQDRLRRAETLARLSSWSDESRLAITRAAIEARELSRARETLRPLVEDRPTMRVCMAMAEIEGRSGSPAKAREWIARSARAPRDKAWIADGLVSERWAPVSPVTGRLDAFVWDTPPEVLGAPALPDGILDMPEEEPAETRPPLPPAKTEPERVDAAGPVPAEAVPAAPAAKPADAPPVVVSGAPGEGPAAAAVPAKPAPAAAAQDAVVAEPVATEPPKRAGSNGAGAHGSAAPGAPNPKGARGVADLAPVVFPVQHAPDDPGPERGGLARRA